MAMAMATVGIKPLTSHILDILGIHLSDFAIADMTTTYTLSWCDFSKYKKFIHYWFS
jgi:hypothetical protein